MNRTRLFLLGIIGLSFSASVHAQAPQFNYVTTRQAGQDLLQGTYTGILQGVAHNAEPKVFAFAAAGMARWMRQFPSTFPPGSDNPAGSDRGKTRALPAIWTDRAEFEQKAANFVAAAEKLSTIARSNDAQEFAQQVKVVGDACDACHTKFRAK